MQSDATFIYRNAKFRYDEATIGASSAHFTEGYPLLIIAVQQVLDVQAAVKCCSSLSIPISIINGGHSFEGLSTTMSDSRQQTIYDPDGLLLHMEKFSIVESVDFVSNATAPAITIQAGMRLG
jgi:FAD/FMN-containing dehydrogenase